MALLGAARPTRRQAKPSRDHLRRHSTARGRYPVRALRARAPTRLLLRRELERRELDEARVEKLLGALESLGVRQRYNEYFKVVCKIEPDELEGVVEDAKRLGIKATGDDMIAAFLLGPLAQISGESREHAIALAFELRSKSKVFNSRVDHAAIALGTGLTSEQADRVVERLLGPDEHRLTAAQCDFQFGNLVAEMARELLQKTGISRG